MPLCEYKESFEKKPCTDKTVCGGYFCALKQETDQSARSGGCGFWKEAESEKEREPEVGRKITGGEKLECLENIK